MKIFPGSSNLALGKKISQHKRIKLGKINCSRFANDEARVWITDEINGDTAIVLQSFSIPVDQQIIEFCLICDAVKKMGARKIIAVIPYFGYGKQDKIFRPGEPLSEKVIVKMVETTSFDKLITLDLHNPAIAGFFDKPVEVLSATDLFWKYFNQHKDRNTVVVAPDAGAIKASTELARSLGLDVAYIDKKRDLSTGKVTIRGISFHVKKKKVFIFDDMIATGGTLIELADFLKQEGAKKITIGVTHHLYLPGVQAKLEKSGIDELMVTDTICPREKYQSKKLKIISVKDVLTKAILKEEK